MGLLGCSQLAYYTWDKHWLERYTLMPQLLGGFTWSLARVGEWIETKSAEFKGWLCLPACGFCGAAAFYQTADPALRESGTQLWAPYLPANASFGSFWHLGGAAGRV